MKIDPMAGVTRYSQVDSSVLYINEAYGEYVFYDDVHGIVTALLNENDRLVEQNKVLTDALKQMSTK